MAARYTGGCACGAVRYEADHEPMVELHCQCLQCQKRSGTGHSSYLTFANRPAVKTSGKVTEWRVAGDSGNFKLHAFCPVCGTPVYVTFEANPDMIAIHTSSLDDAAGFAPTFVTYGVRGHVWDPLDPALQVFERMPPG